MQNESQQGTVLGVKKWLTARKKGMRQQTKNRSFRMRKQMTTLQKRWTKRHIAQTGGLVGTRKMQKVSQKKGK